MEKSPGDATQRIRVDSALLARVSVLRIHQLGRRSGVFLDSLEPSRIHARPHARRVPVPHAIRRASLRRHGVVRQSTLRHRFRKRVNATEPEIRAMWARGEHTCTMFDAPCAVCEKDDEEDEEVDH